MANDYISKLKQLSPALQAELSKEEFLAKVDALDEQYGIKSVLILLGLLLKEINYADLSDKLQADYNLNQFLAKEIKDKFGALIAELGEDLSQEKEIVSNSGAIKTALPPMTYSRADEEEVKKYINIVPAEKNDYLAETKKVISAYDYKENDEVLMKRLENIIISRIKEIRDNLETKEILLKGKKVGGMEFSETDADRLLDLIAGKDDLAESNYQPMEAKAEPKIPTEISNAFGKSKAQPTFEMEDGLPVIRMPEEISSRTAGNNIFITKVEGEKKLPQTPVDDKIKSEEVALPKARPLPFIAEKQIPESVLNAKTASRPNLDDVKLEKKLMGPIEELEMMTIIDFRRIAVNPQAAVNKIKEKIDLLASDSFSQKIAGIEAWQKSEVSRFYRQLGHLSMSEGKNIEEVIKERLISGKPTLSLDEFHAVMELNRALRF